MKNRGVYKISPLDQLRDERPSCRKIFCLIQSNRARLSVEECIAIYRAEKPLPQGCPIDTPTRSVDADMQERAAHPAKQDGG